MRPARWSLLLLMVTTLTIASAAQWRHSRVSAPPGRHPGCEGVASRLPMRNSDGTRS
jgi:hypothetical protein